MAHTVEDINGCTKKIKFTFEPLDLSGEVKNALAKKRKEVNLKGFRKGKAPLEMVEKLYGPQIETDALNSFIQNEFFNAITSENIQMVGHPTFENMKYEAGKKVSFDALVEIFPEFELGEFSNLSFKRDQVLVKDEEVEDIRKNYINSKAQMKELENQDAILEKGQFAVINFQGVMENGDAPENMKAQDYVLEIGSGQFIPGFEDGIVGMKKAEKRSVNLTFPADYHAKDLQGSKVVFEVELLEIKEKIFPDFTDDLAKEFGYESVEDFYAKNRERLLQQKTRQSAEKLNQQILEKIIELNPFDLPGTLITQQENYLKEDLERSLKQQGFNEQMSGEYFAKWSDEIKKKAEFQLRSGLILEKLAKQYNIEVGDNDFDAKIDETAASSGLDKEQVRKYYSDAKVKKNVMYAIREEKTFSKLIEHVQVE